MEREDFKNIQAELYQGRRENQYNNSVKICRWALIAWMLVALLIVLTNECSAQKYNVYIDYNESGKRNLYAKNISADSAAVLVTPYLPCFTASACLYAETVTNNGVLVYVQKSKARKPRKNRKS